MSDIEIKFLTFCGIVYLMLSAFVGLVDLTLLRHQEEELASFPAGDIGEYVFPKKILGIHNVIFFPSYIIIYGWMLICRIINSILY